MGKRTNREYTLEFKQQAVELAIEIGCTRAADKLGINVANVQRWKSKSEEKKTIKKVKVDYEEENRRLHAEVAELKKVNHILKAAAAFFSRDHLK